MPKHNKKLLALAVGSVLLPATSFNAQAANVQPVFESGSGKTRIGLHFDTSVRDMRQDNGRQKMSSSGLFDEELAEPDETFTANLNRYVGDLEAEEKQQHLYLQISHAVMPRIDVYGRLGIARTELNDIHGRESWDFSFSESPALGGGSFTESLGEYPDNFGDSGRSDLGILAGVGASFVLHTWGANNAWQLGLDLMYQYKRQNSGRRVNGFATEIATEEGVHFDVDRITSHEAQAALRIGRQIGKIRPYGGIKYAYQKTKLELDGNMGYFGPFEIRYHDPKFEFENRHRIGYFIGADATVAPGFNIGGQMRFGDDVGANVGFSWGF